MVQPELRVRLVRPVQLAPREQTGSMVPMVRPEQLVLREPMDLMA